MPRSRPPYSPEYRQQMVDLVRGGRTLESLSREFEPTAQSIWNWVRQAERDEGTRTDGLTPEEKEELRRLRREVRVLREEKEILKKAAAWFAQETGISRRSSSSVRRQPADILFEPGFARVDPLRGRKPIRSHRDPLWFSASCRSSRANSFCQSSACKSVIFSGSLSRRAFARSATSTFQPGTSSSSLCFSA